MIESIAGGLISVVRAGYRRRTWLSGLGLLLVLAIGAAYILIGALRINPATPTYTVTVQLKETGGLLPNQDVMFHGSPVGRIDAVNITADAVAAVLKIKSSVKIPSSASVRVAGLSPAGEQYVDFFSRSGAGPFLADGTVIPLGKATTPVTLAQLLADSDGTLAQVDVKKLEIIRKELSLGKDAPEKLTAIIDGGTFLLSALDSVLPETVSLLKTSRIVFTTLADVNNGIATSSGNFRKIFGGVNRMEGGYRKLVDSGAERFKQVDTLFDDNSDTMVQLLANLATVSRIMYLRVPALNALFPDYRGSALVALNSIIHDNALWGIADIYPRYACDYGTPRRPPSNADFPEPYLYSGYCRDDDPAVLIRGAKNAPRPAGDDTADPPPGADFSKTTDPTPKGRFSVPTPYGGPTLPIEPPH